MEINLYVFIGFMVTGVVIAIILGIIRGNKEIERRRKELCSTKFPDGSDDPIDEVITGPITLCTINENIKFDDCPKKDEKRIDEVITKKFKIRD